MAAMKEGGVVGGWTGMNRREKVPLGEDHVWLEEEAERVEPGSMAVVTVLVAKTRVRRNRNWVLRNMFSGVSTFNRVVCVCVYGVCERDITMLLDARVCVLLMFWFRVWKKWGDKCEGWEVKVWYL